MCERERQRETDRHTRSSSSSRNGNASSSAAATGNLQHCLSGHTLSLSVPPSLSLSLSCSHIARARCKLIEIITLVKMLIQLKCAQQQPQHSNQLLTHKQQQSLQLLLQWLLLLSAAGSGATAIYSLTEISSQHAVCRLFCQQQQQQLLQQHQQHVVRSGNMNNSSSSSSRCSNNSWCRMQMRNVASLCLCHSLPVCVAVVVVDFILGLLLLLPRAPMLAAFPVRQVAAF